MRSGNKVRQYRCVGVVQVTSKSSVRYHRERPFRGQPRDVASVVDTSRSDGCVAAVLFLIGTQSLQTVSDPRKTAVVRRQTRKSITLPVEGKGFRSLIDLTTCNGTRERAPASRFVLGHSSTGAKGLEGGWQLNQQQKRLTASIQTLCALSSNIVPVAATWHDHQHHTTACRIQGAKQTSP